MVRTWTFTDECGNSSSVSQTIVVDDTTPPTITCPQDIAIECDESTLPGNTGSLSAADNCDDTPVIDYTDQVTPGSCPHEYTIIRTWTATDECGNSSSCTQTIEVVDTTPPTIVCVNLAFPYESMLTDQVPTNAAELCAQGIEVYDNCTPDDELIVTVGDLVVINEGTDCETDPKTYSRSITVEDECGNVAECTQLIKIVCPSLITDSSLCTFDFDPKEGRQFRLRHHQVAPEEYRVTASNSGRFYYNVFYVGTPGSTVSVLIDVPFPFVTVGGNPIHVYGAFRLVEIDGFYCLDLESDCPDLNGNGEVSKDFTITTEGGNLSPSGAPIILLEDYPSMSATTWVSVEGQMPETGVMLVTIHLDYALKHTEGWMRLEDNLWGTVGSIPATIAECQTYEFSMDATGGDEPVTDTDSVQSVNLFMGGRKFGPKHMRGFAGLVQQDNGSPVAGARIIVYSPKKNTDQLGTVFTDSSGFYYLNTLTKYRKAEYEVEMTPYPDSDPSYKASEFIMVKPNGFGLVNFVLEP
jgi:hypothetical protein